MCKCELCDFVKNNYGKIISALYIMIACLVIFLWGDRIYLPINDNLDSNVSLAKMYKDNNMWVDRTIDVPFLGGVSRDILTNGYSMTSLMDWALPIPVSYAAQYILHIVLSVLGFWFIAKVINKYSETKINPEIFIVFGLFYSMVGVWSPAWIGFSLIPWWFVGVYSLYASQNPKWIIFLCFLAYNTSLPLFGVFICFYMLLGLVALCIHKKKLEIKLILCLGLFFIIYACIAGHIISVGFDNNIITIRSLYKVSYTDHLREVVKKFLDLITMHSNIHYHSGFWTVGVWFWPVVLLGGVAFYENKDFRELGRIFVVSTGCLFFHFVVVATDNFYLRSSVIPFLNGFQFARFIWLSPFFLLLAMATLCNFYGQRKRIAMCTMVLCMLPMSILFAKYPYSNYDIIPVNFRSMFRKEVNPLDFGYSSWKEFYATNLFKKIKQDINYDKEWSVAFFLDPSVLQYNGIFTLDGYYSNYSLEYYKKWDRLIKPALEKAAHHKSYWERSHGIRAYIYSRGYRSVYKYNVDAYPLEIDMNVLKELNARYIFSGVSISNYLECGLEEIGKWHFDEYKYTIYVYKVGYTE